MKHILNLTQGVRLQKSISDGLRQKSFIIKNSTNIVIQVSIFLHLFVYLLSIEYFSSMKTRKCIRLEGYDYSNSGNYFVTIEPNNRKYPFCEIRNKEIILNDIGKIIDKQWKWIFERYDHIQMDEYVIMPDHFHGIIRILPDSQLNVREAQEPPSQHRATRESPVHLPEKFYNRTNLSYIIGAFKMTSSKLIHELGFNDFKWKRSFHDRILREDEIEIRRIYIRNNPIKWNR